MSVEEINQDELLVELKDQAELLGITVHPNIGVAKLQAKIEEKEAEIASAQKEKKAAKVEASNKKVKIIVETRDSEDNISDQFFAYNSMATGKKESILIQFGEEVEVSEDMYNHIIGIKYGEKKAKIVPDADGIPQKVWNTKMKSRFIVSKV